MDINIRQAVLNNLTNSSAEDISAMISDSINQEEKVLPGLGVLLETFWKNASVEDRTYISNTIANNIKKG